MSDVKRARTEDRSPICIVVHGGAWSIPEAQTQRNLDGCETAVAAGYEVLRGGGSALDAVEAAVRALEADDSFNSGRGCSLNERGEAECDAMIMEGSSLRCGAVAGVQRVHPVSLARLVMQKTEHVLLISEGAMDFARKEMGPDNTREELVTPGAEEEWRTWKDYRSNVAGLFAEKGKQNSHDTVGCVALDASGGVACGTSTGGVVGKLRGRVGDSPLVGSGGYADNEVGAVSTTGHGEAIARVTLARLALWNLNAGKVPKEAAQEALATMKQRCGAHGGGCGGIIMVSKSGDFTAQFTTQRMVWASQKGTVGCEGVKWRAIDEPSSS